MNIVRVDPADEALLAEVYRLQQEAHAADRPDEPRPLWEPFLARLRHPDPEHRIEALAAHLDGTVAGRVLIGWPEVDNTHLVNFDLEVSPSHRRRGVGRALVDRVSERGREEQRRTVLTGARRAVPGRPPYAGWPSRDRCRDGQPVPGSGPVSPMTAKPWPGAGRTASRC